MHAISRKECLLRTALPRFAAPLLMALGVAAAPQAHADYVSLTLPQLNVDIRTYSDGSEYNSFFPSSQTFNGVPFTLALTGPSATCPNGCNVWQVPSDGASLTIPVNLYGVTSAYTLINSVFGAYGQTDGTVTFNASGGLIYTVALVQGVNIRDHYNGYFQNVIDGVNAVPIDAFPQDFGTAHFDEQIFNLPAAFGTATLDSIVLTGTWADGNSYNGVPLIAAATVDVAPVPEPASFGLLGAGLLGFAALMRRRRS